MKIKENDINKNFFLFSTFSNFKMFCYKPSIRRLFYNNSFPYRNTFKQFIRFMSEYFFNRYEVIYFTDFNLNIIGLCVIHRCGHGRYSFLKENDLMIGPYIINESYRGNGYSKMFLSEMIKLIPKNFNIYDWIAKKNIPSISTTKFLGGNAIREFNLTPILRNIKFCEENKGEYLLFKIR